MIGTGEGLGLRFGVSMVVRGAGGGRGGLANVELLSAPIGIALPPGRERLVAIIDLDLLPSRP